MSKERELIKDMKILLECTSMGGLQRNADVLIGRAIELLAQPEQEPVEDRIARWHKLGYEQGRKSALNEQEPVAWMWKKHTAGGWLDVVGIDKPSATAHQINIYPLYTTLPKREPLNDEVIYMMILGSKYPNNWEKIKAFARAIEKAHGIGGGE